MNASYFFVVKELRFFTKAGLDLRAGQYLHRYSEAELVASFVSLQSDAFLLIASDRS